MSVRGGIFLADLKSEIDRENAEQQKSHQVYRAFLMLLMMLSELTVGLSLGEDTKLKYVWTLLLNYFKEAKELYELRYKNLLA